MAKLTKAYIDKVAPPKTGYALHWDDGIKGFGLRVTKTGKITYIVQGRVKGKSIQFSIGPHGVFTPHEARDAAREYLRDMRNGIDPRQIKKEEEAASVTLRQVADDYMRDRTLKDSTKAEIERHVTTTFEAWLHKPIVSITRQDVTKRFNEMRKHGLRGKGPAPAQANQSFSVLRALINYARREYRRADGSAVLTDNPVEVLYKKWAPIRPRTTRIQESKVGAVWYALQTARDEAYNPMTLASIELVMFLLLTGTRFTEGAALTWDRVSLEDGWFHLPDPKNSNPVWLPLSTVAVELLAARPRVKGNPHVFPSWGKSRRITNVHDSMKMIVSAAAGEHLSPHDLRRSFCTIGIATLGIDIYKIELLTNHVPKTVTARHYLETSRLEYLKPQVQQIADWIVEQADIAKAQATGENVVVLQA